MEVSPIYYYAQINEIIEGITQQEARTVLSVILCKIF